MKTIRDREESTYYAPFALMGASTNALLLESIVGAVFPAAAASGFRLSLCVVVLALAAHVGFDIAHSRVISNPGVPA